MFRLFKEIRVKILIGYLLLIVIAFFSVFFLFDKRSLISETLALLYESEGDLQALSSGHVRNSRHYRQTFDKMYRNLDSLKQLVTDTLQKQRMDSIIVLLTEKESNSLA